MSEVAHFSKVMTDLVDDWTALRQELKERVREAHPDLTDVLGRTWAWVGGELYRHDSLTWTASMVASEHLRGPSQDALRNPNYEWCDRCKELAQA